MKLVAGLGCRRGCPADELQGLLQQCLAEVGASLGELVALASSEVKVAEPGLIALTERLGLPLYFLPVDTLAAQEACLSRPSERVRDAVGSPGVAEAAALVQAEALFGGHATLIIDKRRSASATCALACISQEAELP
ncbi:cobalamin biosynthesis protein [Pseudomonas sp. JM0905a]|uniref:Cobalamin biosynthesis protein n=1 Tax=Metapseudomonas resinovorans TaxID=53412 RepID=A0ABT4YBC9_METRE|nr:MULTISPECIES: cobalamin biosynthesis protein [Pseudomonas]MBD2835467.1 cobalamin biosynthesis protein [Pseudomonas sp. JM0905a]MDA8486203.1 cobalamin biosynthesis protein [Pseudomonas resinovorans]